MKNQKDNIQNIQRRRQMQMQEKQREREKEREREKNRVSINKVMNNHINAINQKGYNQMPRKKVKIN